MNKFHLKKYNYKTLKILNIFYYYIICHNLNNYQIKIKIKNF